MKEILKKKGITSIIVSLIFAILGIIMISNPEGTTQTITIILGITILLIGIGQIINYFVFKGNTSFYNYELMYGIVAVLISIAMFVYSDVFSTIFRVFIGIWISYEAIMKIGISLKLRNIGVSSWLLMLILAILTLIAGIYIICNKSTIIIATAIIMIIYAVIDIIDEFIFMKNVDKLLE